MPQHSLVLSVSVVTLTDFLGHASDAAQVDAMEIPRSCVVVYVLTLYCKQVYKQSNIYFKLVTNTSTGEAN